MEKTNVNGKDVYKISESMCTRMFEIADENLKNTYPPEEKKGFVAAVLTKDGNIYPGISYVSDTFTLTMHAEAVALSHAALHGNGTNIIAITGPNCHICKQLIYENSLRSKIDIVVLIQEEGKIKQIPISKLMPYPWPDKPSL